MRYFIEKLRNDTLDNFCLTKFFVCYLMSFFLFGELICFQYSFFSLFPSSIQFKMLGAEMVEELNQRAHINLSS